MNDETLDFSQRAALAYARGTNIAVALLAATLICILSYQVIGLRQQRENALSNLDQMEAAYRNSAPQQEQQLAQSKAVQAKLEALVNDLLALANGGDADAKVIVEKYKISQQAPAPAAAAAASPSPAAGL